MAAAELLAFKASPAMKARIEDLAEKRGLNRSQAIRAAVLEATLDGSAPVADKEELLHLLTESARSGNVTAQKALWTILSAQETDTQVEDAVDELDELAARRA